MGPVIFSRRVCRWAISLLTLGALVVVATGRINPSYAASSQAGGANVYVDPIWGQTLWLGTMDPALSTSLSDSEVINKIYAGLVKQAYNDKTGSFDIVPDLAQNWTTSKDGLTYTFKIRPDAKFSDGTPVTAQDFVYSLTRVLDPKTASPANYYLFDIKGATDFNSGKAKTLTGVKALNNQTLQITLWHPVVYFLYALSYNTGFVVKQGLPIGAPLTTNASLVIGAGPWMVKNHTWNYRSQISLVPNPYYYGAKNFKLKELDIVFTGSLDTNFAGYQSGEFPMSQIPAANVSRYQGHPDFHSAPQLSDTWLTMNVTIAPFSNLHFRRAVAYGINRETIANGVLHRTQQALYCWYPQGIIGYDPSCKAKYPHYDPTVAKNELAMARKQLGTISSVSLEYNGGNTDRKRVVDEIQQELRAIGINVLPKAVPDAQWIKDGNTGKIPFIFNGWQDDYPDPQDFSDYIIETGAAENWGRYSNPQVDALFAKGAVEKDAATRAKLYMQAQGMILNEAAGAMLYQAKAYALISTKYHGVELNPGWSVYPQPIGNNWANVSVSS